VRTVSVDEQLDLPRHQRRFACWLMVTGRMGVSAELDLAGPTSPVWRRSQIRPSVEAVS